MTPTVVALVDPSPGNDAALMDTRFGREGRGWL